MTASQTSRAALALAFATIYLVWGSTYLAIRVSVTEIPPFLLASVRFSISGLVLLAALRLRGRPPADLWNRPALIVGLCLVGSNGVLSWVEQRVPSGLSALTVGTVPFCMVLLNWLFPGGDRPTGRTAVGLVVGAIGLLLLLGPGAFPHGLRPSARIYVLFLSLFVWSLGSVYAKHFGTARAATPLWDASAGMLFGGIAMLAVAVATGEVHAIRPAEFTPSVWASFLYLLIVGSMVAYPTYIWLLSRSAPARVATYAYVNPLIAVILGWLILHESLPLRAWLAVPVLLAGVFLITAAADREPSSAAKNRGPMTLPPAPTLDTRTSD